MVKDGAICNVVDNKCNKGSFFSNRNTILLEKSLILSVFLYERENNYRMLRVHFQALTFSCLDFDSLSVMLELFLSKFNFSFIKFLDESLFLQFSACRCHLHMFSYPSLCCDLSHSLRIFFAGRILLWNPPFQCIHYESSNRKCGRYI
jgi:hypothetical protein